MANVFEYATIEVRPREWPRAIEALAGPGRAALERAGGAPFAVFTGWIGLASTQGVVIRAWPDRAAAERADGAGLREIPAIEHFASELLELRASPRTPEPPRGPGVWAHRWFEIDPADRDEFLALSREAWPDFEAAHDARILGMFESLTPPAGSSRLLLVTRYASLAVWERSRRAETPREQQAWQRFRRRQELVRSTIVAIAQLVEG